MTFRLPPPPIKDDISPILKEWLNKLYRFLGDVGNIITWGQVDKTGSKLSDITTRPHSALQGVSGSADQVHVSIQERTDLQELADGTDTALHFHNADRARANHTGTQAASTVVLERIGSSTYSTVQDLQTIFHSAGYVSGGAVTNNGDGTVAIALGSGAIRTSNSETATVKFFDWAAKASQTLTNNALNWVYIDYNSGTPTITSSTTEPNNHHEFVKLAIVYRSGTEVHINQTIRFNIGDHASNMVQMMQEIMPYPHVSGATIGETGTRNLSISAGVFWHGLNRFTTSALDTFVAGSFNVYYRDGLGDFTHLTGQTQVNNTQYDDGDGTLASLSPNRYTNRWVYLATDSDVHIIYGQLQAVALGDIVEESPPTDLPDEIQADSFLIGRIVVREGTATFIQIDSAFTNMLSLTPSNDHGSLSGLSDLDHPASAIINTPAGTISSTNVQDAINELDSAIGAVSGSSPWAIKTSNYTSVSGDRIQANTSAGSFTVTLPATPSANHRVIICDYSGTFAEYPLTIARNGSLLMELTEDMTISKNNVTVIFDYIDSTVGWKIVK